MRAAPDGRVLVVIALAVGCGRVASHPEKQMLSTGNTARATPWTLVYGDGSANVYRLSQARAGEDVQFEYTPVTPETSSTGQYSGGAPKQARIPSGAPRIEEVWQRVEALEKNQSLRAPARAKRTGLFTITTPQGTRDFIVEPGPELDDLHELLQSFRR
jgi:hypothetical protein